MHDLQKEPQQLRVFALMAVGRVQWQMELLSFYQVYSDQKTLNFIDVEVIFSLLMQY